ncbi:MAG: 3-oxoadipyl-CoA thiolase [Bacteroidia bacterium]|nr:3-oxoadipyl-CoA thiolase [Bacteroidia bacterium]
MQTVYIVDGCRTPIGRYGGALASVRPDDLLAHVLRALVARNPTLDRAAIDEVIAGAANQAGEDNRNVARMAVLLAGLPKEVPGYTVNRLCASGLQAVADGYRSIALGEAEVVLAGGAESMSRAPYVMAKPEKAFDSAPRIYDTYLGWRFTNPQLAQAYHPYSMGETAENVAERYQIARAAQDAFALQSQQRWHAAHQAGRFADELVPVDVPTKKGSVTVSVDEHPRPETTLETLGQLKPAFKAGGTVTAGNASGVNDGAAALLLASEAAVTRFGLTPRARIVGSASAGVDPAVMGLGPIPAVQKLTARIGWSIGSIDRIELNEAFAAQALACIQELNLDPARVNVNGGAIAIGHPLGCSGARLAATLVHELQRTGLGRGVATLCVGVGQGLALALERV